jgi:endonuclease/exonuclease/phosphatase (EEP) superfamily protein YafD
MPGCLLALTAFVAPALVGVCLGLVSDGTTPSLLLLCAEPVIWFGLIASSIWAILERRPGVGVSLIVGLLAMIGAIRLPIDPVPAPPPGELAPGAVACRRETTTAGPVRLVSWNTHGLEASLVANALRTLPADAYVLQEVAGPDAIALVARQLDAKHLYAATEGDRGMAIVAPTGFARCGASQSSTAWTLALPTTGERQALAMLAFIRVGPTVAPVVGVHLDRPAGPMELVGWADRIQDSAQRIAGWTEAVGLDNTVVIGDTNTHGTFRHFLATMRSAGLSPTPARPTWPASVLGAPTLPLYHLDRAWYGNAWQVRSATSHRLAGSDHLALQVELEPRKAAQVNTP